MALKRLIKIYCNSARRMVVNSLLGKNLILEKIKTPTNYKLQLIDLKRRLNYGYWRANKINGRDIKLSR